MIKLINAWLTKQRIKRSLKELIQNKIKPIDEVISKVKSSK
jgi:hypothetical protein